MALFFFDTNDAGHLTVDNNGMQCLDFQAVEKQAAWVLRDLSYGWPQCGKRTIVASVRDQEGRIVYVGTTILEGRQNP